MTVVTRSFERRRNFATGLFTSGSQFGGISLAPLSQVLFDRLGYANTFRTFSGLLLAVAISSLVYRSKLSGANSSPTSAKKSPKDMLNVWKSKAYIVWALGTTIVTLGYNIPRYTLAKYASDQGISKDASAWLVSYLCAASAIGRIIFGRLCEWVPTKLYLCQACIIACAICAFLIPYLKSYLALVITCVILGLPDGGFVAALSLVTTEIVGPDKMVEGFGFMLFCQSYSNVIGPPLSGMLYDTYKSYKAAFCFAAVPEVIGALILFLIPYYRRNQVIKYTHEIEYNSNSGILVSGNNPGASNTLNPISEAPILSTTDEPEGEYNVVINLTSDNPDIRLVNVVIHKATETGVTCNDFEIEQAIQDGGLINKAAEVPVSSGECLSAPEGVILEDQPRPGDRGTSVVIEPKSTSMLSVVASSAMKSCSTQTVIHDIGALHPSAETQHTNNSTQTVNQERILPVALVAQPGSPIDNKNQIIAIGPEQSAPGQTFPSQQLIAIVATEPAQAFPNQQLVTVLSNDSQTDFTGQNYEATAINLGLQIKTSNKSLSVEAPASVLRVPSSAMSEGHESPLEEIITLRSEPDVPKISPPPTHKHHVTNAKVETMDITGCHTNVVEGTPEAMLAELDTLVQENELTTNPCLTLGFPASGLNNQEAPLMNCTGFTSEINNQQPSLMTGFTPEPGPQKQESLMLASTFIPEMTSPCLSTAFSTEPSHVTCGGMSDSLTQKQLPEPLKPTSLSSVRGNEQPNTQDVAPATSPLSCELSTVIADVIQSLTSQHTASQKSNKESTISSNMADNSPGISDSTDHLEKKQTTVTENAKTNEPKLTIEPSSQASSELSSYCKLQTSVLHSMQGIVAEGCPEDVALLEDISIDLTLDKDPSFASIVLIDDVEEQNNTTNLNIPDLNIPCLSHEHAVAHPSRISGQDQNFSGLSHAFAHSSVVSSDLSHEPANTQPSGISNQEHPFSALAHEPTIVPSSGISSATDQVLQDNIVLELFSTSGELVAKPIESTNPFYHDINQ